MKRKDLLSKSKLYKMRLEGREQLSFFDEWVGSDNRELFIRAMDNDLHKIAPLRFEHPKNKEKVYYHHYMLCPANGNTLMVVGAFKYPLDFIYVFIVLRSKKYNQPYVVIENYRPQFRNPDTVAMMVANAYNEVLRDVGVKVELEAWEGVELPLMYVEDGWQSYNIELTKMQGRNLVKKGYEDALEIAKKEEKGKQTVCKKSDDIMVYIKHHDKELVVDLLHQAVKGMKAPKEVAMPFRFLKDRGITGHIPYKAVIKKFPELGGLITESRYNEWTNPVRTSYKDDDRYDMLEDMFEMILKTTN